MAWTWRNWLKSSPRPKGGGGCATFLAILMSAAFALLGYLHQNGIRIPPNTLPWEPVDLNAPPGWIAHWQLDQLRRDDQMCRAALAATGETITPLQDRRIDDACGFTNVVRVDRSPVTFSPRTTATCSLTAALVWYQAALQRAALSHMHVPLMRVNQLGTFACRNVNSEADGSRSQHATANAIDIAEFQFANGRTVTVARDYGKDSAEGRFLDAAHDVACTVFNTVLGPQYNRLHGNHFHLDMGPYKVCS